MISANLMVKTPNSKTWERRGEHSFEVLPRIGEIVAKDRDGKGFLYKVVSVHHPDKPTGAVEIFAVEIGPLVDVLMDLFREAK